MILRQTLALQRRPGLTNFGLLASALPLDGLMGGLSRLSMVVCLLRSLALSLDVLHLGIGIRSLRSKLASRRLVVHVFLPHFVPSWTRR